MPTKPTKATRTTAATAKPAATKRTTSATKPAVRRTTAVAKPAAKPAASRRTRTATVVVLPVEPAVQAIDETVAEVIALAAPRPRRRSRAARAVVPVALGSLTQPGARTGDAGCERCGTERVTSLALVLTDGTPVRFTSCHACEHRTWLGPQGPLNRTTVLERTRKIR